MNHHFTLNIQTLPKIDTKADFSIIPSKGKTHIGFKHVLFNLDESIIMILTKMGIKKEQIKEALAPFQVRI